MKFKSLKRWSLKPELDGLVFFAQRLDELLWDFTLDTYKPLALNAPYLCQEALDLIDDINANLIEESNLKHILEELSWSVSSDPIAKALLDLPIDHYILTGENVKPADQKLRLEVLGKTLGPHRYLSECCDQICEQVKEVEKKKIDHSARLLVTTLVNMGMSKKYLFNKTTDFFFSNEGPNIESPDQVRDYLKSIFPFHHDFKIYFIVSDLIETIEQSIDGFDIQIIDRLPEPVEELAAKSDFQTSPGERYIEVSEIEELDVFSAYEKAVGTLDSVSDLFTLFYHKQKIDWKKRAIVEQCCLDAPVVVEVNSNPMEKAFDMPAGRASKELNRLLDNFATRGASLERFKRVADLHGICVASDVIDNQLVNLWTALETLVPAHTGNSRIVKMTDAMLPFLLAAYIRRLVMRLGHDLVIWKPWKVKSILNKLPNARGANMVTRVLSLLCDEKNQPLKEELYAELKDFQLLRYRVFQIGEILRKPESVKEILEIHEKKIRWQIRRIYRTRNLIVHSGRKPSYVHTLIENGHDYLDQILFDVMKLSCGEYRVTSLEQAFELAKVRYQEFQANLSRCKKFEDENYMFLCADFDSLESIVRGPWGHEQSPQDKPPEPQKSHAAEQVVLFPQPGASKSRP